MKILSLILSFAAVLVNWAYAQNANGAWVGIGYQNGDTWAVEVQIVPGGARVDYPDIPCGGVWVFDANTNIRGTEWLTYGHDLCLDGLTVEATTTSAELMIRWFDTNSAEIAHAPLRRADGKRGGGKKDN